MSTTVRETRNVFHENPIVFLQDLQDAIKQGYRVENSIPGYPSLSGVLKEVKIFPADTVKDSDVVTGIVQEDAKSILVQNYDPMVFLLEFQVAVLAGFEVDPTAVAFDALKSVRLVRAEEKVAKPVVLDATIQATPQAEATTEAPKPRKPRTTRK